MLKEILKVFIPTLISYSTFMLVGIVDAMFIGNFFGSEAQAALSLLTPLTLAITCIIFSINIGANTYFGHAVGAGDIKQANKIFNHALIYGTITITIITIILNIALEPFLDAFSDSSVVINYGLDYGRLIIFNMIIMMINILLGFFQRTIGNGNVIAKQAVISLVVNVIFNSVFVIVFKWGIAGIAMASIVSNIAQIIYIVLATRKVDRPEFKLHFVPFEIKLAGSIFINGFSDALFDISLAATTIVNNIILVHYLGDIGLTDMYILSQINLIQLNVLFALADSTNPLVATAYGKGDTERTRKIRSTGVKLAFSSAVIIYVLVFIFKPILFKVYGVDPAIYSQLKTVSSVYLSVVLFFSINQVFTSYFTAIGRSLISLVIGVMRNLVLPIIFTVVISTFAGANGVWVGYSLGEATALVFIIIYTFFIFEKKKSIN